MNYCEHCGKTVAANVTFCPTCGSKVIKKEDKAVSGTVVTNQTSTELPVKDNTTTGFVCSIVGALCCTYVAIPGLILSIMSLKNMNEGKISNEKKWMAIVGIVLSCVGIVNLIWNIIHPNTELINRINEILNR